MEGRAAACCNEAFKIATSSAAYLNNYFMLIGTEGVYSYTFEHEKRDHCPVCGGEALEMSISREWTVEQLIELLTEKQNMCVYSYVVNIHFSPGAVKLRSLPSQPQRSRFISNNHHSWRRLRAQIWRRKFWNLSLKEGKLQLLLRLCPSVCHSSSRICERLFSCMIYSTPSTVAVYSRVIMPPS